MQIRILPVVLLALLPASAIERIDLPAMVDPQIPGLLTVYKDLHAHPELSHFEDHTSAFLASQLREAGYEVTEHVGMYPNGSKAYGIVAVMKNGSGPTVLFRTELDALPVDEKTGLPYASHVHTKNEAGQDVSVMHACGHDLHMTSFLGTARTLAKLKDHWRGTLMFIGQPAEERVDGARAMLAGNLYGRFGKPDYALALHDDPSIEVGKVAVIAGPLMASSNTVEILIRGVGGHGAHPEATRDPIVLSAQVVLALQTIVSRENDPRDPAVVTVGTIHGGSKANIIPDEVRLQLTVRSFSEEARRRILASIARIAKGTAIAAGLPDDRLPVVTVSETESAPVTYNDPVLAQRIRQTFVREFGKENVFEPRGEMVSEDFGLFGLENRTIPTLMFRLGATDPERMKQSRQTGTPLPSLHSSLFAPVAEPAIRMGIIASTSAILDLMGKPQ